MAFVENLAEFFDTDDFAHAATVDGVEVLGYFDSEFVEVNGVESKRPIFMCATSDVSGVTHADPVVYDATNYEIVGIQHDGTGVTVLVLSTI